MKIVLKVLGFLLVWGLICSQLGLGTAASLLVGVALFLFIKLPDIVQSRRAATAAKLKQKQEEESKPKPDTTPLTPERLRQISAAMVPKSADEKTGIYDLEYTGVGLYRPKDIRGPEPQVGDYIEFDLEPDNAFDSDAIVAKDLNGEPVGYLNKGRLREVVRRAIVEGESITAQISHTGTALKAYIGIDRNA